MGRRALVAALLFVAVVAAAVAARGAATASPPLQSARGVLLEVRSSSLVYAESVTLRGFVVLDYLDRFPEGIAQLAEWVMTGRLKFREEIVDGLDEILPTFLRLFDGSNQGKLVIRIPE